MLEILSGPRPEYAEYYTSESRPSWEVRVSLPEDSLDSLAVSISDGLTEAPAKPGYARCVRPNLNPFTIDHTICGQPGDILMGPAVGARLDNFALSEYRCWYVVPAYWQWTSRSGQSSLRVVQIDMDGLILHGHLSAGGLGTIGNFLRLDYRLGAPDVRPGQTAFEWPSGILHPDSAELGICYGGGST